MPAELPRSTQIRRLCSPAMGSRAVDRLSGRFPWWMDQTGSLLSPGMLPRGVFCRVGVGEKEGIAAFGSRVGWHRQRYGVEEQRDQLHHPAPGELRQGSPAHCAL